MNCTISDDSFAVLSYFSNFSNYHKWFFAVFCDSAWLRIVLERVFCKVLQKGCLHSFANTSFGKMSVVWQVLLKFRKKGVLQGFTMQSLLQEGHTNVRNVILPFPQGSLSHFPVACDKL